MTVQAAMTVPTVPITPQTPPMKAPPGLDKPKAPIYKPSLCEALGFTDDEPAPVQKQVPQLWATPDAKPPASGLPLGPPPGFAQIRDNFSVNLSLLTDSDNEDDDESADLDSSDTGKTMSEEADERADG